MSYCRIHGQFNESYDGCPTCQDVEVGAIKALTTLVHSSKNPGDYECPHCRHVALKWWAPRCPLCRGVIQSQYWTNVENVKAGVAERRRSSEQAQREQVERDRPARERTQRRDRIQGDMFLGGLSGLVVGVVIVIAKVIPGASYGTIAICCGAATLLSLVLGLCGIRNGLFGILIGMFIMGLSGAFLGMIVSSLKGLDLYHNGHLPSSMLYVWRNAVVWFTGAGLVVGVFWGALSKQFMPQN